MAAARFLLDTSILIEIARKRRPELRVPLQRHSSAVATSSLSAYELYFAALNSRNPERDEAVAHHVLEWIRPLPFDDAAADAAAELKYRLRAAGTPIGDLDTLIAGHALSLELAVITDNVKHFSRVPGLHVENWLDG
ncbi:PIN domain-containing protein [Nesterenkonia ebinurensis]|uniref:PIN domain-containing protein n=1 Tax=Nesterenkonia ebinurensis TaxID=2608252 RepID=UPI00123D91B9|nr:PIN domain-containing protein [Nesterenkonia ebinurensis]